MKLKIVFLGVFLASSIASAQNQMTFYNFAGRHYGSDKIKKITVRTSCMRNFSFAHHKEKYVIVNPYSNKATINFGRLCRNHASAGWEVTKVEIKMTNQAGYTKTCSSIAGKENKDKITFWTQIYSPGDNFSCTAVVSKWW